MQQLPFLYIGQGLLSLVRYVHCLPEGDWRTCHLMPLAGTVTELVPPHTYEKSPSSTSRLPRFVTLQVYPAELTCSGRCVDGDATLPHLSGCSFGGCCKRGGLATTLRDLSVVPATGPVPVCRPGPSSRTPSRTSLVARIYVQRLHPQRAATPHTNSCMPQPFLVVCQGSTLVLLSVSE